jgi:hypothetical protein
MAPAMDCADVYGATGQFAGGLSERLQPLDVNVDHGVPSENGCDDLRIAAKGYAQLAWLFKGQNVALKNRWWL